MRQPAVLKPVAGPEIPIMDGSAEPFIGLIERAGQSTASAARSLLRVLKPKGRLLIEEPDIRKFRAKMIRVMEKFLLMKSVFCTPEEIKSMVEVHGGSARIEEDGFFTAWVIVEK